MLPGPTMAAVTGPMSRRVPPGIPSALDRRSTERNAHVPPKSVLGRALTLLTAFRPGDAELTLAELTRGAPGGAFPGGRHVAPGGRVRGGQALGSRTKYAGILPKVVSGFLD